jgi:hypothetical protein
MCGTCGELALGSGRPVEAQGEVATDGRRHRGPDGRKRREEHTTGRDVWDTRLWLLFSFALWHRVFLDGSGA